MKALKRVVVDGASNWLFENQNEFCLPHFITGDLDSISDEALNYFQTKLESNQIVRLPDQDETDFDKTISFCLNRFSDFKIDYFVVIWGQTGRIDHNLSCISTLIKNNNRGSLPIYLIDIYSSLSCVLKDAKKIRINAKSEWCSLVPIGQPATISTTGFKWNLLNFQLKFGELISTSNEFDLKQTYCTINCDKPIFFSMHLPE